jgi:hypothetical protein
MKIKPYKMRIVHKHQIAHWILCLLDYKEMKHYIFLKDLLTM